MTESKERTIRWPVLVVLVVFLAGAAYLVSRVHEDTIAGDREPVRPVLDDVPDGGGAAGYVHHEWAVDAGAGPTRVEPRADPQRALMARHFPADAGITAPFEPIERDLVLHDVRGQPPIGTDREPCAVRVLPVHTPEHNCVVRLTCDGRVVYPNPSQTAGFNRCELRDGAPVEVHDRDPTEVDGDPMLELDLTRGRITVEERGDATGRYRLRFRVSR